MKFLFFLIFVIVILPQIANTAFGQEDEEVQTLYGVGSEFGGEGFAVDYLLSTELDPKVKIDTDATTITFTIKGEIKADDDMLFIALHEDLIDMPMWIEVDGIREPDSILSWEGEEAILVIPLKPGTKEITIKGASIIPEFGPIATLILIISIISIVLLTSTKKFSIISLR